MTAELSKRQLEALALVPGDQVYVCSQALRLFDDENARALLLDQGAGI